MLKNIKKIIISLITIILVVSVAYTTYATDGNKSILDEIEELEQEGNGEIDSNGTIEVIPEGTNNTNINNNTNVNENLPETTPHAGLEDYSGLLFVAIFAVSSIYAYKKVKEYNV